jgi:hypothetical protein
MTGGLAGLVQKSDDIAATGRRPGNRPFLGDEKRFDRSGRVWP